MTESPMLFQRRRLPRREFGRRALLLLAVTLAPACTPAPPGNGSAANENSFNLNDNQIPDNTAADNDDNNADAGDEPVEIFFFTTLTGGQVVPSVTTTARGEGDFTLNAERSALQFDVRATGFATAPNAAGFYRGIVGQTGLLIFDLTGRLVVANGTVTLTGDWPVTADDVDNLLAGNIYVSIASAARPAGEIRGQVLPQR